MYTRLEATDVADHGICHMEWPSNRCELAEGVEVVERVVRDLATVLHVRELGNVKQRLLQPVNLLFERLEAFHFTLALPRDSRPVLRLEPLLFRRGVLGACALRS